MKKILIIRSNPVNPDSRVEKEAWALCKNEYSVSILAWDREYNHKVNKDYLTFDGTKVPIYRVGFKASYGEGFKNIMPYIRFQKEIISFIKNNKYDIIHACDFDTALSSIVIAKIKRIKFIFDIFDFIYGNPKNLFEKLIKKIEIQIANNSDAVIICTEERKRQIKESKPKKTIVVHNTPSKKQLTKEEVIVEKSKKIKICYIGILQDGRLLDEIGKYFSEHNEEELYIGGFGKYEAYFRDLSEHYPNIKYFGKISYGKTLYIESMCDIMLGIYDPKIENHKYAAPNKFYESLFVGKPIIMVKNTGMSSIVKDNNIGILIDYNINSFAEGLKILIDRKKEWPNMKKRMNNLYEDSYNWSIMESRLLKLYEEL